MDKSSKTFRAFGKKFGAVKISLQEKTGNRESSEPPELVEGRARAEQTREYQKDVYKTLIKATKASAAASEQQLAAAAAFRNYGNALASGGEHAQLAGMFARLADFQEYSEELRTRLDFLIGLRMSEALKDFIKGDLREARYEHKKYGATRRAYEAAEERLRQVEKSKNSTPAAREQAEADLARAKQNYETAEYNVANLLNDCNRVVDFETLENCCDYLDAYNDFFQKGALWLGEIMPRVQRYRETIFQARRAHEREKEQRHGDVDDTGRRQPRCFGASLDLILARERAVLNNPQQTVPHIVTQAVNYITSPGVAKLEGIFRVSGQKVRIDKLREQYETGDLTQASLPKNDDDDAHCVTGLLKLFLRELPEPLCTYDAFENFTACAGMENHEDRVPILKTEITALPIANQHTLKEILRMCSEVIKHEPSNKMTATNVAIVMGPNILYMHPDKEEPSTMRRNLEMAQSVVETLVLEYDALFAGGPVTRRKTTVTLPRESHYDVGQILAKASDSQHSQASVEASPASAYRSDTSSLQVETSPTPSPVDSSPLPSPTASSGPPPLQRLESSGTWARARPRSSQREFAEDAT